MLALYHETTVENLHSMLRERFLLTDFDLKRRGMSPVGFTYRTEINYACTEQFPGCYMSILLKNTPPCPIDGDSVLLVFPIDLLTRQRNWHYNLADQNGFTGDNTYYYDSASLPLPTGENHEVVFHDSVPIDLVRFVVYKNEPVSVPPLRCVSLTNFRLDRPIRGAPARLLNRSLPVRGVVDFMVKPAPETDGEWLRYFANAENREAL